MTDEGQSNHGWSGFFNLPVLASILNSFLSRIYSNYDLLHLSGIQRAMARKAVTSSVARSESWPLLFVPRVTIASTRIVWWFVRASVFIRTSRCYTSIPNTASIAKPVFPNVPSKQSFMKTISRHLGRAMFVSMPNVPLLCSRWDISPKNRHR